MVLVLCKCGGLCGSSGSACSYVWWLNKQAKYTRRYSARALNKEPYILAQRAAIEQELACPWGTGPRKDKQNSTMTLP